MRFDCHMHTYLCGHAQGRPEEYVTKALEQGLELVTFTCHIPIEGPGFLQEGIRMNKSQLPVYREMVLRAKNYGESLGLQVLYGIEAEVFPEAEYLDSMKQTLNEEPFDFVLGSLHHQLPIFRRWLVENGFIKDPEIIEAYFRALANGAASGLYHSMSHPDVIRIYGTVNSFEPEEYKPVIMTFLEALVEHDVCMEVNTSGLIKGVYKLHPDPRILDWAQDLGVRLTLGSDSHRPSQVGQFFPEVLSLLRSKGFNNLYYHRAGKRIEVPIGEMLKSRN